MGEFLDTAILAVREAEKIILAHRENLVIDIKADMSPVTQADKEAEHRIKEIIHKKFPDHGFIGEEEGRSNIDSEYVWSIDPIDGTKNYARGIPLYGTVLSLIHKKKPIVGVSNVPEMKDLMHAETGSGAFLNNRKVKVSSISELNEAYVCTGGLKYFDPVRLHKFVKLARGHRGIGDVWCYHLLSQGKIDVMMEAHIKIWDIGAFIVIASEAGGKLTDIEGKEFTLDSASVLATNGLLHQKVLDAH